MASEDFMSGFETGSFDDSDPLTGTSTIITISPISGVYSLTCVGTNVGTSRQWVFAVTMSVLSGNTGQGRARFRFRINSSLPSDDTPFCGFGATTTSTIARGELDSGGHFRLRTEDPGSYSTATLDVDTIYIAELLINIINSDTDLVNGELSIYTDSGTLIETVSSSGLSAFLSANIKPFFLGWSGAGTKTADFTFDDLVIRADTISTVTLPSTRTHKIAAAAPTGAGATTDWTGSFTDVDDLPFNNADVNVQATSGNGNTELYTHPNATFVGAQSIEGIKASGLARSSLAQTHAIMLGGVEYLSTWPTAYGRTVVGVDLSEISNATFDALEFGVRNKTGTATTTLNAILIQVLGGEKPDVIQVF